MTGSKPKLSVVIPVAGRCDPVAPLYYEYLRALPLGRDELEFVYVLDGEQPEALAELKRLQADGEPVRAVTLARWFGEATALAIGVDEARAEMILALPAYRQIESADIPRLLAAVEDADIAVGRRHPRVDGVFNRLQYAVFHAVVKACAGFCIGDLGCAVFAFRRAVFDEVSLYGDMHRFLPMLAHRQGFKVREVDLRQSRREKGPRVYRPGTYVRRLLDAFTMAFLLRFLKRPFRFFGLISYAVLLVGFALMSYVLVEKFALGVPAASRPTLVIASVILVLGVQIFAIGLIAELIIFTHARGIKDYRVERLVNLQARESAPAPARRAQPARNDAGLALGG